MSLGSPQLKRTGVVLFGLLPSCLDAGLDDVHVPLRLAGTAVEAPFVVRGDWQVELEQAELAFGPLTLCAGARPGGFCDTARAEWRSSAVVDVLSAEPALVGELIGSGGMVRSSMYDLGFVSLLTQGEPLVLPAAEALGGNSLRLTGRALRGSAAIRFTAELRVEDADGMPSGFPAIRHTSTPDQVRDLGEPGLSLAVRFDARPWLENVDFDGLLASDGCQPACPDPVGFAEGSQPYRAVRSDVEGGSRPVFEWSAEGL
jgi:hypothetical protein